MKDTPTFIDKTIDNYNNELTKACLREQLLKEDCQDLERELTAAREELSEWSILNGWGGTPEIINDFIKGQQTRIHYAQNLDEELTAVTEQRDRLAEAMRQMRSSGDIVICSQSATNLTTNEL
jgi:hypothetical protein